MDEDILRWSERDKDFNDKYAAIPISSKEPIVLKVKVISGFDIDRDIPVLDFCDKPNPQIVVEYTGAAGSKKFKTTQKHDTVTPKWNESFRFVISEEENKTNNKNSLKFSLFVEGAFGSLLNIGEAFYDPSDIKLGEKVFTVILFGENGKLNVEITKKRKSYLRLSLGLCEKELEFRSKRLPKVMRSFQHALGNHVSPTNIFETPIMSLVASGGGLRATTAMCGVMEGLDEISLLDCMTYAFGTSGGSWYLACAFATQAFKGKNRDEYHSFLKKSLETSATWELINPTNISQLMKIHKAKTEAGQPFTFVDYYGVCVANKLLDEKFSSIKLSNLRSYVETADVPYVILNSSQVDNTHDVKTYRADCNLTPHECEMPQYGVNVDTKRLNSLFFSGVMERKLPEPELAYMIGMLGSIFGLRLNRILGLEKWEEQLKSTTDSSESTEGSVFQDFLKFLSALPEFHDRNKFIERTGQILNIAHGFVDMQRHRINPFATSQEGQFDGFRENDETMNLVDGGILCNVAIGAALRPQRRNDILFVADFTYYDQDINFETLTSAIRLSKEGGYKFPPIDVEKIKREKTKELYVFEDENDLDCPLVFWLLTTTDRFKQVPNYTPRDRKVLKELSGSEKFNQFVVMGSETYDTFNFRYSKLDFDRLRELMIYNITVNKEVIMNKIRERIKRKRNA